MAAFMVLIMSSYNMLLHTSGQHWFSGWYNLAAEFLLAFPLALLLVGKAAALAAHKLLKNCQSEAVRGITITFFIALIMVPLMSSFVILHKFGWQNTDKDVYIKAFISNFALAFPLQVFILKRLVCCIFRQIIGFKYRFRAYVHKLHPLLNNPISIVSTKAALVSVMLFAGYVFI